MDDLDLRKVSGNLFDLLVLLNKNIFSRADLIKGWPIPPSQVKVIFYLIYNGSQPISQIGQNLCISKPNMTPIIDKLINDGFVNRYEDPHDRRVLRVEVTEKSRELFNNHINLMKDSLCNKISTLSPNELSTLQESVITLSDIISKLK